MRSNGMGAVLAGAGELTAAGLTAAGVPTEFDSDKFMENVAPMTSMLGAAGSAGLQRQNMTDTVRAAQTPQKPPPAIIRPATPAAPTPQTAAPASAVGTTRTAKPPSPTVQPATPVPPAPQAETPAAAGNTQAVKPPPPRSVPVSSPTNNSDFSSVGKSVGTEAPGTVNVAPRRNTYPDFSPVPPANQPTATAQTAKLSSQLREPIPANRVLVAPWVGRVRNAQGEMMSSGTSEGWLRNESRFWSEFKRQFPSDFALIGPGRTVTPQLAQRWGWSNRTIGQKLVHHHIDNGNLVVAVPEGLHQGASGSIHATVRIEGRP
jgi:hypothetical protein